MSTRLRSAAVLALALALASCGPKDAAPTFTDAPITARSATLSVRGMSCPLCANNVDQQLMAIPGVQAVRVHMGTGDVAVDLSGNPPVSKKQLADAVYKSGFTLEGVKTP